jgi:hypothetical protein
VLTATVGGAGTAPASVLSTGSVAPRKAELGRADPILIPRGGPKPWRSYQQNAGNRCANRRSRRSRPTVAAEVMCSHRVQLCAVLAPLDSSVLSLTSTASGLVLEPATSRRRGYGSSFAWVRQVVDGPRQPTARHGRPGDPVVPPHGPARSVEPTTRTTSPVAGEFCPPPARPPVRQRGSSGCRCAVPPGHRQRKRIQPVVVPLGWFAVNG